MNEFPNNKTEIPPRPLQIPPPMKDSNQFGLSSETTFNLTKFYFSPQNEDIPKNNHNKEDLCPNLQLKAHIINKEKYQQYNQNTNPSLKYQEGDSLDITSAEISQLFDERTLTNNMDIPSSLLKSQIYYSGNNTPTKSQGKVDVSNSFLTPNKKLNISRISNNPNNNIAISPLKKSIDKACIFSPLSPLKNHITNDIGEPENTSKTLISQLGFRNVVDQSIQSTITEKKNIFKNSLKDFDEKQKSFENIDTKIGQVLKNQIEKTTILEGNIDFTCTPPKNMKNTTNSNYNDYSTQEHTPSMVYQTQRTPKCSITPFEVSPGILGTPLKSEKSIYLIKTDRKAVTNEKKSLYKEDRITTSRKLLFKAQIGSFYSHNVRRELLQSQKELNSGLRCLNSCLQSQGNFKFFIKECFFYTFYSNEMIGQAYTRLQKCLKVIFYILYEGREGTQTALSII